MNQAIETSGVGDTKRVRDAMQLHIVSVVPEMTVRELIHILIENGISGAPVVDPSGKVIGVVSATDVLRLGAQEAEIPSGQLEWNPLIPAAEERDESEAGWDTTVAFTAPGAAIPEAAFDNVQVRDIMTPVPFTVRPIDSLGTAIRMMRHGRVHRLLVMDDDFLYGIITPHDILELVDWE